MRMYGQRSLTAVAAGLAVLSWGPRPAAGARCAESNYCNGHGTCIVSSSTCACFVGWGADTDLSTIKNPDCSSRVCPTGLAWSDIASAENEAHATAECSNRGICNTATGECGCFDGFTGDACQRTICPNECSGHGRCMNNKQLAQKSDALPLVNATYLYTGKETTVTWDEEKIYGCLCDSSWTVGLGPNERQEPEWFGYDCSLKRCPSGDDPRTTTDETNCWNVTAAGGFGLGQQGNKCQVDCSNRGICDYGAGTCTCFKGYHGQACETYAVNSDN